VAVPNGFQENGTPLSITFCGRMYGEAQALAVARAYQEATAWDERHPPAFGSAPPVAGSAQPAATTPKPPE
jgi:hypothetical protein